METLQLSVTDRLAIVTLDRGRSNPMNHQMVKGLTSCVLELGADDNVGGLILTGKEGFFSSGIDLIEAYNYDEAQIRAFWTDFLHLQYVLASFTKPLVAAISGHSPAGGCVMALCCDYRVMIEGNYIIGLNEVPVGIIVPDSVFELYAFWLGRRVAYQCLLEGKLHKVNEAQQLGLIDAVTTPEDLMLTATQQVKTYMQFNPAVWGQTKMNLRKHLLGKLNADPTEGLNQMLEQWWAPATRKGLEMMIQNLKSKK